MILSRFIDHVKKQHRTAVFLDFVIVVIGVLVAMQVNNWNEQRRDRRDQRFNIARLHDDLAVAEESGRRL